MRRPTPALTIGAAAAVAVLGAACNSDPMSGPPTANLEAFDLGTVYVHRESGTLNVDLVLRPKPGFGCMAIEAQTPATVNGMHGTVVQNPEFPYCNSPTIRFTNPPLPLSGGYDATIDLKDGRILVIQNVLAPRGWTLDGVLVEQIVAAAGDVVTLSWTPDTDRILDHIAFGSSPAVPLDGHGVTLTIPDLTTPESPSVPFGNTMFFSPPVSQCVGFTNCAELAAACLTCQDLPVTGVWGPWTSHLTLVRPAP